MNSNHFMGLDGFVWFTGVVEDRNDPAKLGRVRVRCLGFHTENKNDIPTKALPWAHVMHPVTDPSMQGMGNTPTFLLEGSWVVGFFRDAQEKQQPIIMGSLPGVPSSAADSSKGFNDPNANYPNTKISQSGHSTGESDTNRLARGGADAEAHQSLIDRRESRVTDIPIATKPNFGADGVSTKLISEDPPTTWEEPHPQGIPTSTSQYPYNHVFESESGHIFEVDDTPGNERLHREHRTGTSEELFADGSRMTKIVQDDYEIVYGDKSVFIAGNVNLTISGNVRHLIQGDYVQEVEGDYTLKVGKNMYTKIGALGVGNYELDILGGHSYRVADDYKGVVGIGDSSKSNYDIQIMGSESRQVGGSSRTSVVGNVSLITSESLSIIAKTKIAISQTSTTGTIKIDAKGGLITRITGASREKYDSSLRTEIDGTVVNITKGSVTESFLAGQTTTITGDQTTTTTGVINLN